MADSANGSSGGRFPWVSWLWSRGGGRVALEEPVKALANGDGHVETKAQALLPQLNGVEPEFFSSDGGATFVDLQRATSMAFAAYWYVAKRWRAQKIAEAPLMVVKEDQADGSEDWLNDHELAQVLDDPSPDYDMGELLERTSHYLDDGASALWVLDRDRAGRIARITPFASTEFQVKAANGRLYGLFIVKTAAGDKPFAPEQVCYFQDGVGGWSSGKSRFDVACQWLNLGESARSTIRDLLKNSVWPSFAQLADKDWNPDEDTLAKYKQDLAGYGLSGNKGKPIVLLGGGQFTPLSAKIRDLVPSDVLNRVESIVAAVSGVPAIVLQFQVGMENSPWSQMEQARRMAYDDTIHPAWRRIEKVLTRQLLRPDDEDRTHFVRFDKTRIASLQIDLQQAATTASLMGRAASLNERRNVMGLEPSDDPAADEIPELTPIVPPPGTGANNDTGAFGAKAFSVGVLHTAFRNESKAEWHSHAVHLLRTDANHIEQIVLERLPAQKSTESDMRRVLVAVDAYLNAHVRSMKGQWGPVVFQLLKQGAERAAAVIAADLGISYPQLQPEVVKFAEREAAKLIKGIADTTRDRVQAAIARGLEEGKSVSEVARLVAESGAFTPSRAQLIAQTESTRASNGGPTEALSAFAKASGRTITKRWQGKLDGKERDEHIAMEGETVFVSDVFSNGLMYPSEPNCRCVLFYAEVTDA